LPTREARTPRLGLAVALVVIGPLACSVDPLMPGPMAGTNGGGASGHGGAAGTSASGGTMGNGGTNGSDCGPPPPVVACRIGRTFVECVHDATGSHWSVWCPDDPTGAGGATGGGGGTGGGTAGAGGATGAVPCASTASCATGEICTTENGVCNPAPGCGAGVACPAVCYGTCVPGQSGPACGAARCAAGMICCNDSCGICTASNEGCTKQLCVPPAGGGACTRDADCRVEADYCAGCDCRALGPTQSLPPCAGPGVRCLVNPCGGKAALCVNGYCALQ